MKILSADLVVPGWCSFRIPHSINVHLTFPAPPPSTLYGLIANSLGLAQDDYSLRKQMRFGVRIVDSGSRVESYTQWMKWNPSKESMTMLVTRQKLLFPHFRIYVAGEESLLTQIQESLHRPARLLYLGESDDLVEIQNIALQQGNPIESRHLDSAVPERLLNQNVPVNEGVSVVHWPVSFGKERRTQYSVQYEMVYIGTRVELTQPISCLELSDTCDRIVFEGERMDAES